MQQLTLGEVARDAAVAKCEESSPGWIELIVSFVRGMVGGFEFTTDDLWERDARFREGEASARAARASNHVPPSPNDPRAMGAALIAARRDGLISATGGYRKSTRPECHARPVAIWRRS